MLVELDIGNTRCKWRLRDVSGGISLRGTSAVAELDELLASWGGHGIARILVASVSDAQAEQKLHETIHSRLGIHPVFVRTQSALAGLKNAYADPQRLGVDRWLAMLAAWTDTHGAVCVIDCGSAITMDLVDGSGLHRGGYIVPGINMMRRALLSQTGRVRFEDAEYAASTEPGKSTAAGVFNGTLTAAAGLLEHGFAQMSHWVRDPKIFITGGDAEQILPFVSLTAEHREDLVLDGLAVAGRLSH